MKLTTLTREQCQQVREWRNKELQFLRTQYPITEQMQDEFYDNVVNNLDSKHRYFAIIEGMIDNKGFFKEGYKGSHSEFIGMGGLTNIEWENGTAEISLIINPEYRGKGYGKKAVIMLLKEAFDNMRLNSVYGEVYDCANRGFWEKIINESTNKVGDIYTYKTNLVERKFFNGQHYGSMWFSFVRVDE